MDKAMGYARPFQTKRRARSWLNFSGDHLFRSGSGSYLNCSWKGQHTSADRCLQINPDKLLQFLMEMSAYYLPALSGAFSSFPASTPAATDTLE